MKDVIRPMSTPTLTASDPTFHKMVLDGTPYDIIGEHFGFSRERARQLAAGVLDSQEAFDTREAAKARLALDAAKARALAYAQADPDASCAGIARHSGVAIDAEGVAKVLHDAGLPPRTIRDNPPDARGVTYTDEALLDSLRAASAAQDGRPLSTPDYRDYVTRTPGAPSHALYRLRFGSWRNACSTAGIAYNDVERVWASTFTDEDLQSAVDAFFGEHGAMGNTTQYIAWSEAQQPPVPKLATLRQRLGTWNSIRDSWVARRIRDESAAS